MPDCPWCGKELQSSSTIRTHALQVTDGVHPDSKKEIAEGIAKIPIKKSRTSAYKEKIERLEEKVSRLEGERPESEKADTEEDSWED